MATRQYIPLEPNTRLRLLHTLSRHRAAVRAVAWSPHGMALATGGKDGALVRWELAHPDTPHLLDQRAGWATALAWHPRLPLIVNGDSKGELSGWDLNITERAWTHRFGRTRLTALA